MITLEDHKAKNKSGRIYLNDIVEKNQIPLLKVNHVNDQEVLDALKQHQIDWLFIIGWSQIASEEVLSVPRKGVIGAHPTLLPQGRGRAAIPWAIIKGLDKTGVTLFKLDKGVDTGLIIDQVEIPLSDTETSTTLYQKVNEAHIDLIRSAWDNLQSDNVSFLLQDESKASNWPGRKPADGELFPEMTVAEVDRMVRACTRPYPGAFIIHDNEKVIIWTGQKGESPDSSLKLRFADGIYSVLDFETESL